MWKELILTPHFVKHVVVGAIYANFIQLEFSEANKAQCMFFDENVFSRDLTFNGSKKTLLKIVCERLSCLWAISKHVVKNLLLVKHKGEKNCQGEQFYGNFFGYHVDVQKD